MPEAAQPQRHNAWTNSQAGQQGEPPLSSVAGALTHTKGLLLQEKLGVPPAQQQEMVQDMVKSYVEGLCWVMSYYYDGEHPLKALSSESKAPPIDQKILLVDKVRSMAAVVAAKLVLLHALPARARKSQTYSGNTCMPWSLLQLEYSSNGAWPF